jgi:hypothetical protein
MNLTAALKIHGFTNEGELRWLAEQASIRSKIVEIGSWKGRSTRAMADNTNGTIYAVDTWKGTPEDPHFKELIGKPDSYLIDLFGANMDPLWFEPPHKVRCVQLPSLEAAKYIGGRAPFDMIFIDAAHDYENVVADIRAWQPLLAPGGLLCGHDFEPGRGGVIRAVKDCLPNARRLGIGTIWVAA